METPVTHHPTVSPPPARFNFAQHLIDCNRGRPTKLAYIDDQGSLSYGALADHIQRLAAAVREQFTQPPDATAVIVPVPDIPVSSQQVVTARLQRPMPDGYLACAQLVGPTAALAGGRIMGWQITNARRVDVQVRNASATDVLTGVFLLVTATLPAPSPDPG